MGYFGVEYLAVLGYLAFQVENDCSKTALVPGFKAPSDHFGLTRRPCEPWSKLRFYGLIAQPLPGKPSNTKQQATISPSSPLLRQSSPKAHDFAVRSFDHGLLEDWSWRWSPKATCIYLSICLP